MLLLAIGLAIGFSAPKKCACGLPGYTLNAAQSKCNRSSDSTADYCIPAKSLCPNAAADPDPSRSCIGETTFMSSLGTAQRMSGTLGFLYAGEPLWMSLLESQLVHVPSFMEGLPMWASSHLLPATTVVSQVCPSSSSVPGCRFYVFLFGCQEGCAADSDVGALGSVLLPMGYEVSHCAPKFKQYNNGQHHDMTSFVKLVPSGHTETFELPNTVRHMVTAIDRFAHDCPSYDQVECIVPGVMDCVWEAATSKCISTLCPDDETLAFRGPQLPGTCGTCPGVEAQ